MPRGDDRGRGSASRRGKGAPGKARANSKARANPKARTNPKARAKPTPRAGAAAKRRSSTTVPGGNRTSKKGSPRRSKPEARQHPEFPPDEGPRSWGGVARRGAGRLKAEDDATAAAIWRKTVRDSRPPESRTPRATTDDDEIVEVREVATDAVDRGRARTRRPRRRSEPVDMTEVRSELTATAGPSQAPRLAERLGEAGRAYSRERYVDARRMLRPLAQQAPSSAAVRELYGLSLYRLGKWRDAARELEQFRLLTNSTEQHPVLADCYRALGRYSEVEDLWGELREASPSAALVTEGRIVMAGSLADQDRMADAIRLMEQGVKYPKRAREHHLRMWYVLADLYERAGDAVRARQLFRRVAEELPDFADVPARLRALG